MRTVIDILKILEKNIFTYIFKMEDDLNIDDYDLYIEMFAVQTPKQGNKLGSRLMRELFRNCDIEKKNLLLYTNTDRNVSIYKHFGFEVVLEKHVKECSRIINGSC